MEDSNQINNNHLPEIMTINDLDIQPAKKIGLIQQFLNNHAYYVSDLELFIDHNERQKQY